MHRIATIGGGTGTFILLSALKEHPVDLAAIISMADDGGSTGVLRDQYGVLPPGDVRRALVALSESSNTMRDLFNYRFRAGGLRGHNFGNLFISALEKVTGNFASALHETSLILNISGEVVPVTLDNVRLCARLERGKIVRGETNIDIPSLPRSEPIKEVWLEPEARLNPSVKRVLHSADMIVLGPGDLYTSIIPNLLVNGIAKEIKRSKAIKVYVCNLMTKAGETDNFTGEDFVKEIEKYLGKNVLDYVIFNNKKPSPEILRRYKRERSFFVKPPAPKAKRNKPHYILTNLIDNGKFMRHGPRRKLANVILSLFEK